MESVFSVGNSASPVVTRASTGLTTAVVWWQGLVEFSPAADGDFYYFFLCVLPDK